MQTKRFVSPFWVAEQFIQGRIIAEIIFELEDLDQEGS